MTDNTCNGYTNWDTFIVCLYSDNEERLYNTKIVEIDKLIAAGVDVVTKAGAYNVARKSGLTSFCRHAEPDFRSSRVDWSDVADSWTDDLKEFK